MITAIITAVAAIVYNADKYGRKSSKAKGDTKRDVVQEEGLPDDVKMNGVSKKTEKAIVVSGDTTEWRQVSKKDDFGSRISELIKKEHEFFSQTKNYSIQKAELIKPLWAKGLTPKEISKHFIDAGETRGYSKETVRLYTRKFNHYHPLSDKKNAESEEE